ncbi:SNARE associated Golgi protein [Corchorus olitorius]|uniref:SNARE associated Golgi protein n=1 Tax=Corchorus olitorius TaxID=93759 RepID=A0A1R3K0G5_9ROSI|nr:SNARE associated Golgi protein [Corchorus olitorius]
MEINNVEYERITEEEEDAYNNGEHGLGSHEESKSESPSNGKSWKNLLSFIAIFVPLAILAILAIHYLGPLLLKQVIVPLIRWESDKFDSLERVIAIFASLAIFPALCLPSTPSMWVAGMTYGYVNGYLLVMAGISVGVSLPYFLGSIFRAKIQALLEKHPKQASVLRLAGEGNWLHQFEAITLIRISPLPYIIVNYAVVATNVNYSPYLLGTWVGMVPEVFVALYSGILIRSFAVASKDKKTISVKQIVFNVAGFCASVVATILIGIHTKKLLDKKRKEVIDTSDRKYEEPIQTQST